jgi:hypothetical protein
LIPYIGHKERVSDIFRHKRQLSIEMIRRLHEGLNMLADLLIGKSRKAYPAVDDNVTGTKSENKRTQI